MIRDYENTFVQKIGSAIGSNESTIETGSGDDLLTVVAKGHTQATGIQDSSIDLDKGDDILNVNSSAIGYTNHIYRDLEI